MPAIALPPGRPVVFIRLRLLGDILMTIPAVVLFKDRYPDNPIHYVVEERFRQAAEFIPGIAAIVPVPAPMTMTGMGSFYRRIHRLTPAMAVDFHSGPTGALLTWSSRAPVRIGYQTPNRNWAYHFRLPRRPQDHPTHSVYNQATLLSPLGIDPARVAPYPELSPALDEFLPGDAGLPGECGSRVVLHLGAGGSARDWGEDRFGELAGRLVRAGLEVHLIGHSAAERERAQRLKSRVAVTDWTGRLTLRQTLHLIARSGVYCGADSGPMHLASLSRTPIVALFGPNLPEISGPWRTDRVTVLQPDRPCRPCSQPRRDCGTMPCIRDIEVRSVYEAIQNSLGRA